MPEQATDATSGTQETTGATPAAAAETTEQTGATPASTDQTASTTGQPGAVAGTPPEGGLGESGEAALDSERKARKAAERRAKEAEAKAKGYEDKELSELERLRRDAESNKTAAEKATAKVRRANLLTSLVDKGLSGGKARAAVRLLDNVEYDDDDLPTNIDAALESAKAQYGEEVFTGGAMPPGDAPPPATQGEHQGGARPNAEAASEEDSYRRYMEQHFPQAAVSQTQAQPPGG